ncbi:MAG: PAC2 family protein [Dehalococcoidia bacterium]|nr:PAC2 family protein [Dehalococcoidia bacterium]
MPHLLIDRRPDLHDPVAVVAFSGWNDAASAATDAARFIVRRLGARKFATIDAEDFYDFRENRPTVSVGVGGARELKWPANEFFHARNPTGPHDIVIAVGIEPDLAWRQFAEAHLKLYREFGVSLVVSLGALMADVPHTRPVRVTGSAIDSEVAARLDLAASKYEGPTGIVGTLGSALREASIDSASLWANVPHYISTSQNPIATSALLERLQTILGVTFDLSDLATSGERFRAEIETALSGNPEVADYVRRLETALDSGLEDTGETEGELPPARDVLFDVEEFLRNQREDS